MALNSAPFLRQCFLKNNNPCPSDLKCQNCGRHDNLTELEVNMMSMWVCTNDENDDFPCFESAWEFMESYQSAPDEPKVKRIIFEGD